MYIHLMNAWYDATLRINENGDMVEIYKEKNKDVFSLKPEKGFDHLCNVRKGFNPRTELIDESFPAFLIKNKLKLLSVESEDIKEMFKVYEL